MRYTLCSWLSRIVSAASPSEFGELMMDMTEEMRSVVIATMVKEEH